MNEPIEQTIEMQKVNQKFHIDIYRHENQVVNDAYDRLVAGIHLQKKKNGYSTFTISGCEPGVGATTISISIAVSMATSGWRTILVDADMRKNPINKRLNEHIKLGLSDYLEGNTTFDNVLCQTNFETLDYISCGSNTDNPVGLLCSNNFDKLLERINEHYDFIIFDSPSLNATVDAGILSAKTSATILVAQHNKTRLPQLKASKRELDNVGARLLGVVLNKVDKSEYKQFLKNYDYFSK